MRAAKLRMLTNAKQALMALHLACTYLAAKNIDKVRRPCLRQIASLVMKPAPAHAFMPLAACMDQTACGRHHDVTCSSIAEPYTPQPHCMTGLPPACTWQVHGRRAVPESNLIAQVRYRSLLTLILSHAHGCELPPRVAADLEIELLQALRWRLGPFYHCVPSCCAAQAHAYS